MFIRICSSCDTLTGVSPAHMCSNRLQQPHNPEEDDEKMDGQMDVFTDISCPLW